MESIQHIQYINGKTIMKDIISTFGSLDKMNATAIRKTKGKVIIFTNTAELIVNDRDWVVKGFEGNLFVMTDEEMHSGKLCDESQVYGNDCKGGHCT